MTELHKTKLFYLRNEQDFPVACVASNYIDEKTIRYAVSTHNPLDVYNRERARDIAMIRLKGSRNNFCSQVLAGTGVKERILTDIVTSVDAEGNPLFPRRARVAAQIWLEVKSREQMLAELDPVEEQNFAAGIERGYLVDGTPQE